MINVKDIPERKTGIENLIAYPQNIPFDGRYAFPINLNDVHITHNSLAGRSNYILSNNLTITPSNVLKYSVDFNLTGSEISGPADNIVINDNSLDKRKFKYIENATLAGTNGATIYLGNNLYFDSSTGRGTLKGVGGDFLYQEMSTFVDATDIVGIGYYFFTDDLPTTSITYGDDLFQHFYIINQSVDNITVGTISVEAGEMCIICGDEKLKSTIELPPDEEDNIVLPDDNNFVVTNNIVSNTYSPIPVYDFFKVGTEVNPVIKIKTTTTDLEFVVKGALNGTLTEGVNYTVEYDSEEEEYTISFIAASNSSKYGKYDSTVTGGITGNSDNTGDGGFNIYAKRKDIRERLIYDFSITTVKSLIVGSYSYNLLPFTYELTGNILTDGKIIGSSYTLTTAKISQGPGVVDVPLILGTPVTYDGITSVIHANGDYTITTEKNVYRYYPVFQITVTNSNGVTDTGTRAITVSEPVYPDQDKPLVLFVQANEITEINLFEYFNFFGNFYVVDGLGDSTSLYYGTVNVLEDGDLIIDSASAFNTLSDAGFIIGLANGFQYFVNVRVASLTYRGGGFSAEYFRISLNGYFSQILVKLYGETEYIAFSSNDYVKPIKEDETTGDLLTGKDYLWDGQYWNGIIENRLSNQDVLPVQTPTDEIHYIGASDIRPINMGNNIEWLGAGGTSRLPVTTIVFGRANGVPIEIQEILISPAVSGNKFMALPNRLRISVEEDLLPPEENYHNVFQTDITDNNIAREWYDFEINSPREALMNYGGFFRFRFRI